MVENAKALIEYLDYHPLVISTAANTIRNRGSTIADYLNHLKANDRPSIVGSTVDQNPMAKRLLKVSSMLSLAAIPATLFTAQWQSSETSSQVQVLLQQIQGMSWLYNVVE